MEHRRVLPRQPTDWRGTYKFDGDSGKPWRRCRIVDFSTGGAALELADATPEEAHGRQIVVSVQLRGEIRNAAAGEKDTARVGIQFTDLSGPARSYLQSLEDLGGRW